MIVQQAFCLRYWQLILILSFLNFISLSKIRAQDKEEAKQLYANKISETQQLSPLVEAIWEYQLADKTWKKIKATFRENTDSIAAKWKNPIYFRTEFEVDSSLLNQTLTFNLRMRGKMRIYLNNVLIHQIGRVNAKYTELHPVAISLSDTNRYQLLIEYVNPKGQELAQKYDWTWVGAYTGFEIEYIGVGKESLPKFQQSILNFSVAHYIIATLLVVVAISHLAQFFFVLRRGIYLWFALFLLLIATTSSLSIYSDVLRANTPIDLSAMLLIENINLPLILLMDLATIRCLHYFFYSHLPKIWFVFIFLVVLVYLYTLLIADLSQASLLRTLFHIVSLLEALRTASAAMINQKEQSFAAQNAFIIIIGAVIAAILEILGVLLNVLYGWNVFSSSLLFFIANSAIIVIVSAIQMFINRVEGQRQKNLQEDLALARENEQKMKLRETAKELKIQYERERIARDLHDNVGSQLTFLLKKIEGLQLKPNIKAQDNLVLEELTRQTIQELRNTVWLMKQDSPSLSKLQEQVYDLVWRLKSITNIKITCELDEDNTKEVWLSSSQAINSFRIIQEALQNALKYSQATEIMIKIEILTPAKLLFLVNDNGIGFDKTQVDSRKNHNGLINMQARCQILGSNLEINSQPNAGTQISFIINL